MPPIEMNPLARRLFDALDSIPLAEYPPGVQPVPHDGRITRTCFFPAGCGVWNPTGTRGPLPDRLVMILGHNWGIPADFQQAVRDGIEFDESWPQRERSRCTTWYNLLPILRGAEIPLDSCFFTNFYMGLKANDGKNTGEMPKNDVFRARCQTFLQQQLAVVKPSLVICLGQPAIHSLSRATSGLECWRGSKGGELTTKDAVQQGPRVSVFQSENDRRMRCVAVAVPHPCMRSNLSQGLLDEIACVKHAHTISLAVT